MQNIHKNIGKELKLAWKLYKPQVSVETRIVDQSLVISSPWNSLPYFLIS